MRPGTPGKPAIPVLHRLRVDAQYAAGRSDGRQAVRQVVQPNSGVLTGKLPSVARAGHIAR